MTIVNKELTIHSSARSANANPNETYHFTYEFVEPVRNVVAISGYEWSGYNTFPNVHDRNNQLIITDAGGTDTITVGEGFYTPDDLKDELETQLNASSTLIKTYTVSIDSTAKAFIININDTGPFSVDGGSLLRVLGFTTQDSFVDTVSEVISDSVWSLNGIGTFYVGVLDGIPVKREVVRRVREGCEGF